MMISSPTLIVYHLPFLISTLISPLCIHHQALLPTLSFPLAASQPGRQPALLPLTFRERVPLKYILFFTLSYILFFLCHASHGCRPIWLHTPPASLYFFWSPCIPSIVPNHHSATSAPFTLHWHIPSISLNIPSLLLFIQLVSYLQSTVVSFNHHYLPSLKDFISFDVNTS